MKIPAIIIWAQLHLAQGDCDRIRSFLVSEVGVKPRYVVRKMHLTVYHARRPMPGVEPMSEPACVVLAAEDTRFMVMAPGGENPRPELEPGRRKVGIRIHRQSQAASAIRVFRERLLSLETASVLGKRSRSTHKTSAFGSRHFQPHMALLRSGSGIDRDLKRIGTAFRRALGTLTFDRFVIDVVTPLAGGTHNDRET